MTENSLDRAGEARLYRALRRFWHPVMWADELGDRPVAALLLDEPLAIVRLDGEVRAFKDLCVHRGTALSLGWVEDGSSSSAPTTAGRTTPTACAPGSRPATGPTSRARRGSRPTGGGARGPDLGLPRRRRAGDAAARVPGVGRRRVSQDQDPAVRLALQRGAAGRELRRLQPLRVGPRGHPGRPLEARDPRPRRRPDETTLGFELGIEEPANPLKGDAAAADRIQRNPSRYTISMPFSVRLDQPLPDDRHFVLFVASCPLSAKETRNFTWNARNYELEPTATRASSTSSR